MNTFGHKLRLTTFGESHGAAIGGVLDGMPAGIVVDEAFISQEMKRRRPGQSALTTGRFETDEVTLLSGVFEGVTTGAPLAFTVLNKDQHSEHYEPLKDLLRPSHADFTYMSKYNGIRDWRGGGRASARTTVAQCAGGALAKLALSRFLPELDIYAFTSQIGHITVDREMECEFSRQISESNPVRCPQESKTPLMEELIRSVKSEGDSIGGVVTCLIKGVPAGLGEPHFAKLHADLGAAMLGINAAKGFEYGDGFEAAVQRGSYHNDSFEVRQGHIAARTNHSGGIQGGISNGETIRFRVAFKPTPTISMPQQTVNVEGQERTIQATGRHDPCVAPRAVPLVEAMAALVILDHYLLSR